MGDRRGGGRVGGCRSRRRRGGRGVQRRADADADDHSADAHALPDRDDNRDHQPVADGERNDDADQHGDGDSAAANDDTDAAADRDQTAVADVDAQRAPYDHG
jgi:hypothetical protein